MKNIDTDNVGYGKVQGGAGRAAFEYIRKSSELARNKEALKAGNVDFIGHTEILAGLTNTQDPLTMFQVHN